MSGWISRFDESAGVNRRCHRCAEQGFHLTDEECLAALRRARALHANVTVNTFLAALRTELARHRELAVRHRRRDRRRRPYCVS